MRVNTALRDPFSLTFNITIVCMLSRAPSWVTGEQECKDDDESDPPRQRDQAVAPEWKADVSKWEGNVGVSASVCVTVASGLGERMTSYLTVKSVYRETYSGWHQSLGKGGVHGLVFLNHSVLYKHWTVGFLTRTLRSSLPPGTKHL